MPLFPRTTARVQTATEILDTERRRFLERLDAAPFDVTDWEASFIEDFLTRPRPFTPSQRRSIDDMHTRYEGSL